MDYTRIEEITRQWGGLLNLEKAFEDLTPIALCLDAQRRLNESHDFGPQFKRCNIPLVIRVFRESKAFKKNDFVNYDEGEKPEIHMFNTKWNPPTGERFSLDAERDYLAEVASKITKEVDAIFEDMSNECIIFHGFGCLKDGTLTLAFSR